MPLHGRLGNRFVVSLLRRFYGANITDIGSFRAIKSQTLFGLEMEQMTYDYMFLVPLKYLFIKV
jgi:hypothetical protein